MKNQVKDIIRNKFGEEPTKIIDITQGKWESNRGSFLVYLKDRKVKVIVLPNKDRIREVIKNCLILKDITPKVIYHKQNGMIVEWIKGQIFPEGNLKISVIKQIARFQAKIHKKKIKYNQDKIISDFKKDIAIQIKFLSSKSKLTKLEAKFIKNYIEKRFPKKPRISLIHGDFNLDNIIKTKDGWKTIDNERLRPFLTFIDLNKPLKNICQTEINKKMYLKEYSKVVSIDSYLKDAEFYKTIFYLHRLYLMTKFNKTKRIIKEKRRLINTLTLK